MAQSPRVGASSIDSWKLGNTNVIQHTSGGSFALVREHTGSVCRPRDKMCLSIPYLLPLCHTVSRQPSSLLSCFGTSPRLTENPTYSWSAVLRKWSRYSFKFSIFLICSRFSHIITHWTIFDHWHWTARPGPRSRRAS